MVPLFMQSKAWTLNIPHPKRQPGAPQHHEVQFSHITMSHLAIKSSSALATLSEQKPHENENKHIKHPKQRRPPQHTRRVQQEHVSLAMRLSSGAVPEGSTEHYLSCYQGRAAIQSSQKQSGWEITPCLGAAYSRASSLGN